MEQNKTPDFSQYSPLVLAYMGDAIYEVYVRQYLVTKEHMPVQKLHKKATEFVKANGQSRMFSIIEPLLTEEELGFFKRGRNAKSHPPKNADLLEYKRATGFEALMGYLFLSGQTERLETLIDTMLKNC